MTRLCPWFALTLVMCASGWTSAATLERLSMDDMVQKSTVIVRGRVLTSSASSRGSMIYTHYTVQVLERWKGAANSREDIAVPGGAVNGLRQVFPGAPSLNANTEYVFFLWTSRSGLTQIIGFSQGLIDSKVDASGQIVLSRGASNEQMLDSAGHPAMDSAFSMSLADFRIMMRGHGLASGN